MKNKDNEIQSLICQEILYGDLPDNALEWTRIEVLRSTIIKGSGESATWVTYITIRENGKQIWKGSPIEFEYVNKPLEKYGDKLVKVGNLRKSEIFVVKP